MIGDIISYFSSSRGVGTRISIVAALLLLLWVEELSDIDLSDRLAWGSSIGASSPCNVVSVNFLMKKFSTFAILGGFSGD